jgi:hypothetical protein
VASIAHVDGSGTTTMPHGAANPEISDAFTVAPVMASYSPIVVPD